MKKRTHKAFGVASAAALAISYNSVVGRPITNDLVPELAKKITFKDLTTIDFDLLNSASQFSIILQYVFFLLAAYAASTLPDIDQNIPGIKHRTWTHTIYPVLALSGLTYYFAKHHITGYPLQDLWIPIVLAGMTVGYTSHLIGDAFSTSGINWFNPYGYRDYGNGSRVVKGFRGPFIPIYTVGQGPIGAKFWMCIAVALTTYLIVTA